MSLISYRNLGTNTDTILREVSKGKLHQVTLPLWKLTPRSVNPKHMTPRNWLSRMEHQSMWSPRDVTAINFEKKINYFLMKKCVKSIFRISPKCNFFSKGCMFHSCGFCSPRNSNYIRHLQTKAYDPRFKSRLLNIETILDQICTVCVMKGGE